MKTVLVHGCFDVLHVGHIRLLKYARSLGDELVVSLLSDQYVKRYKGKARPIHSLEIRKEQMEALRYVNRVVVVDGPGHEAVQEMILKVKPSVYVKGSGSKGQFGEESWVREQGIEMVFMDMVDGFSSTGVISEVAARLNVSATKLVQDDRNPDATAYWSIDDMRADESARCFDAAFKALERLDSVRHMWNGPIHQAADLLRHATGPQAPTSEPIVTLPVAVRLSLMTLLNHVEPGWENCRAVVQHWLSNAKHV